jgi:hypothetical protein
VCWTEIGEDGNKKKVGYTAEEEEGERINNVGERSTARVLTKGGGTATGT